MLLDSEPLKKAKKDRLRINGKGKISKGWDHMTQKVSQTADGGFREEVFNVFLAILLNERGIVSIAENIRRVSSRTRRIPDITITEFWGVRVIIEGKIFESASIKNSLIRDAKKRINEGLSPICIAVLYPPELRTVHWEEIKDILTDAPLRIKVITDTTEGEWFGTTVDGLAAVLRRTYESLVEEDVVNNAVERLKEAIDNAAISFADNPAIPERLRSRLGVFGERNAEDLRGDDLRVCRIASLAIINALIFQEVLASNKARVSTIRSTLEESDIISAFSQSWKHILDEINYVPIFKIARQILLELPSSPETKSAIILLSGEASQITMQRTALKHDLMGRIYHRLLRDAKYFGAYYTMIPSATLLLELTFDSRFWDCDYGNQNEIRSLKFADLACGTGTLLKAALESIVDDYVKGALEAGEKPELENLYKLLIEDTIYGFDVLPFAAHLSASTLALHAPDTPFDRMNLYVLPLGGAELSLGSLDFLSSRTIPIRQDLFGALSGPSQVTGQGDILVSAKIPELDLCVMNPPFTRSVGGNLLFGSYEENERNRMQKKLRRMIKRENIKANITAGLGSVFVALADKYLKNNGHLSLVLPKSLLSGVAWSKTRDILSENYRVRYIIVSHEPNSWNFSENTELSECLIVADKRGNTKLSKNCFVINLWRRPQSNIEALSLSSLILSASPVEIEHTGTCELILDTKKYGEIISIPSVEIMNDFCSLTTAFAQTDLIRAAYYLSNGSLYLPGYGQVATFPVTRLGNLFEIGFDRRDIHDGFNVSRAQTSYPAMWGHKSNDVTVIEQLPNQYLSPLPHAKPSRNLRNPMVLWSGSGRLLIAERIRLNTHRLFSIWCQDNVLSNVWWTLKCKENNNQNITDIEMEKILSLWLNSALGIIQVLTVRTETEGAWIEFKKPNLGSLPVLDPRLLTHDQINEFVVLYESVSHQNLLNISQADVDETRQAIDDGIARILSLPDYSVLRDLLSREPAVTLRRL